VIGVARPDLFERHPGFVTAAGGTRIVLPPLSETQTAILLSGLLDRAVLPADTQAALLDRSGGNPLYAEEFVRMLGDRGLLEPGPVRLPADTAIPIPDTIQAIIGARLDALEHPTKALLQDASVVGRVFWDRALVRMGGRDERDVRERLDELARLELIRPIEASSVRGDREHAFWHILVRDVAYGQIPRAERASKHRAVADWIGSISGERQDDRADLIAYHYGQAFDLLDRDDPDLRDRTVRAFERAGRSAFRLNAASAETLYRKALALTPPDDPSAARLLMRVADVETSLARFADARRDFDAAIDAMDRAGDRLGLGEALALKARALHRPEDTRASHELLQRAIGILEAEPPGPELVRAYTRMAGDDLIGGRFAECRTHAERALRSAEELGLDDEIVRARQYLGAARCELGDPDGIADLWEAVRLGLAAGIGVDTAIAYANLAVQLWELDGPATALEVWEAAVEFAHARGFRTEELWARAGLLEVMFDLGRWDEVASTAAALADADPEEGGGQLRAFADIYRASVLARRGRLDEAALLVEGFVPGVRTLGRAEFLAPALTVAAVLEQLRGHHGAAVELADEFGRETQEHDVYRLLFLPDAVRVLVACGELVRAGALVPDEGRARNDRHRHAISSARAAIAEATGDLPDAARRYEACAAAWSRYGSAFERAQALLGHARTLRALDDAGAVDAMERAREALADLGAAPWLERVDGSGHRRRRGDVIPAPPARTGRRP
jgi:tetratricopeptide (TPR) repeat protein